MKDIIEVIAEENKKFDKLNERMTHDEVLRQQLFYKRLGEIQVLLERMLENV